jgi:transcriptional regulator with XRE-family HTH domain
MPESFGARLRQRREEQHIALSAVAEQTKLKSSLLEALERDDVSQWPSGIFRRSWFRCYAHAIGLDADTALRDFLAAHPEPEEATVADAPAPPPQPALRRFVHGALDSLSRLRRRPTPVQAPTPIPESISLAALARLCTELGRVTSARQMPALLADVAALLDASGVIVWVWDRRAEVLRPALVHGYDQRMIAGLPPVTRDADNPTAAAFRAAETQAVTGALVIPLLVPSSCGGVLAIELRRGGGVSEPTRAAATIVAAALAQLVARARSGQPRARVAPAAAAQPSAQTARHGAP